MEPERWGEVDALFAAALDCPPEERASFLDRACPGDAGLREEVERLLAADERARTFLELPASLAAELDGEEAPAAGARFGPYRIERLLSRGGMGTVYLATRDDGQFDRQVALKLLHRGSRDPEVLQRFRAERQILARLEHPGIARLYDGGETAGGLPFLVMEYVEGSPLDVYCDTNRLSLEQRLALFRKLLDAVAYAHQNLLVHRDLKPANVLVTAAGEPKLLDFGIAKQLAAAGGGEAAATRLRPMTPRYASPEQVHGEAITTASDVYALGVVLYELLCGHRPYRLESDMPHELEAAILRQEPERPSQALDRPPVAADAPAREAIAAARRARPGELRRRLRGDLDTIVLTALRKEPARRYRSVVELAADVDRFLHELPIAARPDTLRYRSGKFVRRHRLGVAMAGIALALIAGLFTSLLAQRDRAQRERDKSRTALAFLVDVFAHADPYQKGAEKLSAGELLDTGARRARRELGGDPEVQAALADAIGKASLGLGRVAEAAPLLERALAVRRRTAPGSLELADSLESVAWLRFQRGDYDGAEPLFREAIALQRRLGGADPSPLAFTLNQYGTMLSERYQGSDAARLREIEGLHSEALAIYRRVQGPAGRGVGDSLFSLAKLRKDSGDLAAAEGFMRQALRIDVAQRGAEHPETASARRLLALILIDRGKLAEADQQLRSALAAQRKLLPKGHPDIAWTTNDLALVRARRGDYAGAEALLRESLAFALETRGESHAETAVVLNNLANQVADQGRPGEAAALYQKALSIRRAVLGERHHYVAQSLGGLARARSAQGRHAEALELARRSYTLDHELLKPGHPDLGASLRTMGTVLLAAGRPAEAEPYLRQGLEVLRRTQTPGFLPTARFEVQLGACLTALGRYPEAEELLTHGRGVLEAQLSPAHRLVREEREKLAALYRAWGRPQPAGAARR